MSKKIFIVTGELSGDRLAAWYIQKNFPADERQNVHAVAGDYVQQTGARLFDRFENLNVVGIVEIIKHIPRLLSYLKRLCNHIIANNYREIVLVDFPGFNMRLNSDFAILELNQ